MRMIIIDDEIWAQRGLSEIIDWESIGFKKCGCFDDPQKALDYIVSDSPDVVFTDIRMPGMSGLELLEKCRESNENIIFVVVSAYSDFRYAKKALENGAFGYILKPLDIDQVSKVAYRISEKLKKKKNSVLNEDIRDYLVFSLLHNTDIPPKQNIKRLLEKTGDYRIIITNSTDKAASPSVSETEPDFVCRVSDNDFLHIVPEKYSFPYSTYAHSGESTSGKTVDDLPRLIREGMEAFYTAEFLEEQTVIYKINESKPFEKDLTKLCEFIRMKDSSSAAGSLQEIKKIILCDKIMISRIVYFYNRFLDELQKHSTIEDFRDMLDSFSDYFQMFSIMRNIRSLFENLHILLDVLDPDPDRENAVQNEIISEIVRYVDENFANGITLEQISIDFHMSLSHISRQFKRITGMTYSNYISEKKVEQAKTLLAHSSETIAEVGEKSGYSDYFYFLRSFKRATGYTPTQYRKRFGAG